MYSDSFMPCDNIICLDLHQLTKIEITLLSLRNFNPSGTAVSLGNPLSTNRTKCN